MGSFLSSPVSYSAGSMIFPSPECSYTENDDYFRWVPYENCTLSCGHTKKHVPAFMFCQPTTKTTVIYSHGNGEDIGHSKHWLYALHKNLNVNVIGYDYEGYGLHSGSSSENACYRDIETIVSYLKNKFDIDTKDIVLYGRSLGTGPTVNIATKHKFKGVVLEAPYKSIFDVVSENLAYSSVCLNPFRNESKIDRIQCPIVIFHGKKDMVIDYAHSKALQKKSNCNLVTLNEGGHNDLQVYYKDRIMNVIKETFF
jgi:abhydrolase domain-containing protein 17